MIFRLKFRIKHRFQIERNNRKSGLIREIVPTIFNHESLMLHRQHFETDVECRGYSNFAVPFMQNKKPVKLCDLHFNENNRRFEWEKRAEFFMSKYREMKTKESLIEFSKLFSRFTEWDLFFSPLLVRLVALATGARRFQTVFIIVIIIDCF